MFHNLKTVTDLPHGAKCCFMLDKVSSAILGRIPVVKTIWNVSTKVLRNHQVLICKKNCYYSLEGKKDESFCTK